MDNAVVMGHCIDEQRHSLVHRPLTRFRRVSLKSDEFKVKNDSKISEFKNWNNFLLSNREMPSVSKQTSLATSFLQSQISITDN